MSTLKVSSIQNASTSSGGVSIDTSGHVTIDGANFPTAGPLSNRNLIINGAMQVAQRGASSSGVTATGYYATDHYRFITQAGAWTISRSTEAPTGFSRSWKADCTTSASLTGTQALIIQQRIEAQYLQHLNYGTANAEQLTCSFWVRSNKTGVVTVEFYQADDNRQISRTITINSTNTWEFKTVTIPGDITGVIDDDAGPGLDVSWWLDAGPNLKSGTLNTGGWAALTNANRVSSSNISLTDSTANEFYLTGVQLEVGSVATPFEHRSYGQELALCQRYYQTTIVNIRDTVDAAGKIFEQAIVFKPQMRQTPVATRTGSTNNVSQLNILPFNADGGRVELNPASNGDAYALNQIVTLSAEL